MKLALVPYCCWTLVLIALAALANQPVDAGLPPGFLRWAGFPFQFVMWTGGKLEWFEFESLAIDVGIWLAVIVVVPLILSLRWKSKSPEQANFPQEPIQ